jgi:anti-sigma B factor antagonist
MPARLRACGDQVRRARARYIHGRRARPAAEGRNNVEIKSEGTDPVVLAVQGEVDLATAPQLERELTTALATPGATGVRVDLSGVEFMDSAGLRVLVAALRTAEDGGRTLTLSSPHERVRRIIQITGLSEVFVLDAPA